MQGPTVIGTGSFEFEAASGVYSELQCGSYIFMDADYGRNRDRDGEPTKAFEPSLFVWATVMSRPPRTVRSSMPASRRWPSTRARRWSATSTAGLQCRPPPTGSGSATRSG
jgi:D-serine deaminase-like pyridoxal phosphate-dependent protein